MLAYKTNNVDFPKQIIICLIFLENIVLSTGINVDILGQESVKVMVVEFVKTQI